MIDAEGLFFGDPGKGQITERGEAVFTGAAGENLAVSKAEMPNFTSKSGTRVVYG